MKKIKALTCVSSLFWGLSFEGIYASSYVNNNFVVNALELIQAVANNQIISQVGINLNDLSALTGDIASITQVKYSLSSLSTMPAFSFIFLDTDLSGFTSYAFIAPSSAYPGSSFTALHNTSYDTFNWQSVLQEVNNGGIYITLLAFDENNQLITSVINSTTANFNKLVLAIYDHTGVMIDGMPLVFPAGNAYQIGSFNSIYSIYFMLNTTNTMKIFNPPSITNYPFLVALNIISPETVANVLDLAQALFKNSKRNFSEKNSNN